MQNIIFVTKVVFGFEEMTGCNGAVPFLVFGWRAQRQSRPRRGIFLIYAGQSRIRNYEVRACPQLLVSSSVSSSLVPSSFSVRVRVRTRPPPRARPSSSVDLLRPASDMEASVACSAVVHSSSPRRRCCLHASPCCATLHHRAGRAG